MEKYYKMLVRVQQNIKNCITNENLKVLKNNVFMNSSLTWFDDITWWALPSLPSTTQSPEKVMAVSADYPNIKESLIY